MEALGNPYETNAWRGAGIRLAGMFDLAVLVTLCLAFTSACRWCRMRSAGPTSCFRGLVNNQQLTLDSRYFWRADSNADCRA